MDIESLNKNKEYVKCKYIVKNWEKDFKSKFSRTPSKFDIKEAPSKIKYAYKKYCQLKTAALENSLSLCETDDVLNATSDLLQCNKLTIDTSNACSEQICPPLPSAQELEKMLLNSVASSTVIHEQACWGNLSKNLFHVKKFSSLNSLKSGKSKSQTLYENKSKICDKELNKLTLVSVSNVTSEDLNTDLGHNTKIIKQPDNLNNFKCTSTIRKIDDAWLQRTVDLDLGKNRIPCIESKTIQYKEQADKFGLGNMSIPIPNDKQPCDIVENSESEDDVTLDKLKPILKKRKIEMRKDKVINNDLKSEQTKLNLTQIRKKRMGQNVVKSKKILSPAKSNNEDIQSEQLPDISEYVPFGLEKDIFPRHSDIKNIKSLDNGPEIQSLNTETENINKLSEKIKNGTINDNFVKINIEKKVFVKCKKGFNFSKYKKQMWKNSKALNANVELHDKGKFTCFKCGNAGHMARYCTAHKGDSLLPVNGYDENEIPSLEDMQKLYLEEYNSTETSITENFGILFTPSQIPDSFLNMLEKSNNSSSNHVKPLFTTADQVISEDLHKVLKKFGHSSFRLGQKEVIERILCGMSTLMISSTGGGKSLCYQLPAYMYRQQYKCITLVISPLISLMEDQVLNMPEFLKAGCLNTNQSPSQRNKILQCLKNGEIHILLISPEALVSADSSSGFVGLFKSLPPIAFACIDEVHCVSEWSHNFRPSYLLICRVLREKLNVKCILGLTATATQRTIKSIISHLCIPDHLSGVITNPTLPDNLFLSVSFEDNKDKGLISFLNTERVSSFNSIIIYCIRRDECERVAGVIRSCLQENGKQNMEKQNKKRKRMSYIAEAYHAGMSAAQRKKIQNNFMDGSLRIIVATVAFGMGINKTDIRCIIHYNMPSNFESYVQEAGRAGRDALPAFCHMLLNNSIEDKNELLKHIYANSIDRCAIRKLLKKIFIPCECVSSQKKSKNSSSENTHCNGHEVGIPIDTTVEELDLPPENIATLLCYIELHPKHYIKVLNNAYIMCKVSSYGGPQKILQAAKSCRPLAMAIFLESKNDPGVIKNSVIEFNVIEVAAAIGWESGITKYQLKNLEWVIEGGMSKRSHLKVEFNTLGFKIKAPGDLMAIELDTILNDLHISVMTQEKARLYQLEESYKTFRKVGNYSVEKISLTENELEEKSNELKHIIRNYFENCDIPDVFILEERSCNEDHVRSDVKALISSYRDCVFTGRSIARIFQGISSPNYPAIVWGKCKFWRSHLHEDFNSLVKIATQQIIQMRM